VFSRANERSHAVMVPRREALLGKPRDQKMSSRRRDRLGDHQSASPYISAVSMGHAEIDAAASAAMASLRSPVDTRCPADHGHLGFAAAEQPRFHGMFAVDCDTLQLGTRGLDHPG